MGLTKVLDGGTNFTSATASLQLLATIDATPNATTFEFTMDYDDYNNFLIIIERFQGDSTSANENWDCKFKLNGVLDDGASTPYSSSNELVDNGTRRNINTVDNMEFVTTNLFTKNWTGTLHCTNFRGNNGGHPSIAHELSGCVAGSNNFGSFHGHSAMEIPNKQVTAMRYAVTNGNITVVKQKIYGINQ
tara:strand:+ start:46 stop:615 length:570 start_codon:yes stop_codon:yes gene_type:complete